MFTAGAVDAKPMVNHAFTLDGYSDALDMFRTGTGTQTPNPPPSTGILRTPPTQLVTTSVCVGPSTTWSVNLTI